MEANGVNKKLIGMYEPVYKGKHVSEMTDSELDEFADWLASEAKSRLESGNDSTK